jgi:hypothetical protein
MCGVGDARRAPSREKVLGGNTMAVKKAAKKAAKKPVKKAPAKKAVAKKKK